MVNMKIFKVKGKIFKTLILKKSKKEGKDTKKTIVYNFEKEIIGTSEKDVLEKIYSFFGSVFKVKRKRIKIEEINEIKENEITNKDLKRFIERWR
ncbi:MAG: 50S ribosomal protein L18Ae [Candidatus Aenigmatarchaeota archaeon]